ncbi:hypothetical protein ACT1UF_12720 [Clostridium septicum]|uniref:hypothetical protein n=1 Tax=Clostridium septicum TaxID=1504 RepID=UPI00082ACA0C|nr:hypothetical protein [Clostridium septicum]MDU1313702.1 hypothetical protein [Clostridium septicum]WLF68889.1 hypothetical protein Q6375_13015 [Clostridium septicum]
MNIIINELKKIFNIKSILVVGVICFLIYQMFIEFHIKIFPNGYPDTDTYEIAKRIVEEKGVLPKEGLEYLRGIENEYKIKATEYLKENKLAQELGITNYDEYADKVNNIHKKHYESENDMDKKINQLYDDIMFVNKVDAYWNLQGIEGFIMRVRGKKITDNMESLSKSQINRLNEIINSESYNDVLPELVFSNYNEFIINSAILILISVVFFIAPIFTKDKHNKLEYIQYSTKRGRKLYKDKILTSLIATFIIATVELGGLFYLYLTRENTVEMFYNSSINSIFRYKMNWFDVNFKEYIILCVVLVYIFAFAISLITCYISRKSDRYITLTGICILLAILLTSILRSNYMVYSGLGDLYIPRFFIEGILLIILLVGVTLISLRYRKEKRINI